VSRGLATIVAIILRTLGWLRPSSRATTIAVIMTLSMRRVLAALLLSPIVVGCGTTPDKGSEAPRATTVLVGGRVQVAPDAPAISDGVVVLRDGAITAVGGRDSVRVPPNAEVLDCTGATITAGFWNSHVHFTQPVWSGAATAPAARLTDGLRAMLTSYGVVRVLDTGSEPGNTDALRQRIESGEVPGPFIMRASGSFVPVGGSPYYVLPARLPELASPSAATAMVDAVASRGAGGREALHRVVGVPDLDRRDAARSRARCRGRCASPRPVRHRPPVQQCGRAGSHRGRRRHPRAHVPDRARPPPLGPGPAGLMRERGMALVPTLKLFPYELKKVDLPPAVVATVLGNGQAQLRAFTELGGQVLFGTDVGYMTDYDPTDEYVFMQAAGLSYARILASLTTAPAERFGAAARTGRLAPA
jgi:hypothetical protein